MTRINAIKLILIMSVLQGLLLTSSIQPAALSAGSGEPVSTFLTAWPDRPFYLEGGMVQLEVSIWDENGITVEGGMIRVRDLNGSVDIQVAVDIQVTILTWTAAPEGLTGVHTYEITYSDTSGQYLPSSTVLELMIGKEITAGEEEMSLQPSNPVLTVTKGQAVNSTGNLTSRSSVFPYFYIDMETACITIDAEIGGSWRILNVLYPSSGLVSVYEFEIPFVLPAWVPTGGVPFRYSFSGSASSDLAAAEAAFTVNLLAQKKSIVLLPGQGTVERNNLTEKNTLTVEIQVPGFDSDPVAVNIDLLAEDGTPVAVILADHLLTAYSSQLSLEFSKDIPIGDYSLSASLIDWQTGAVLAADSAPITVIDDLLVDNFYWNVTGQLVTQGQDIQGYLVSREEDTFLSVKTDLHVRMAGTGEELFTGVTGENGYISFTITVPNDLSPGSHEMEFVLTPLASDQYHQSTIKSLPVVIQLGTSIAHQQSPYLVRQQEGWFNATVIDEQGQLVTAGTLTLNINGNLLYSSASATASYNYAVPAGTPRGVNLFQWFYSGEGIYSDSAKSFPLAVYSTPSFTDLNLNAVEIFPGGEAVITGRLLEETGIIITGAPVTINHKDNWGNVSSFQVITDGEGIFTYSFSPGEDNSGTHFITVEFNGWPEEYYLSVPGKPAFEVSVSPPVSLSVNGDLVAGENVTLEFHGKPGQEVLVELYDDANWLELDVITLDSVGMLGYEWNIPGHLRGETLLRASYSGGQEFAIFSLKIRIRPHLDLEISESLVMTGEEVLVYISCSENHSIFLDGKPWQIDLSPGSREYALVYAEAGDHELEIVATGDDVLETAKKVLFQIREDYTVTIDIPERVQRGEELNVIVTVKSREEQPLRGFTVELGINNSLVATVVTSLTGEVMMTLSLTKGFYTLTIKLIPTELLVYTIKEVTNQSLTVYGIPTIELPDFEAVKGRLAMIKARIIDGQDPIAGEAVSFRLKSINQNIDDFIGSNVTDDNGYAVLTWNVTRESGNYLLQVENQGNELLEPVVVTKAIQVLEKGPDILQASVIIQASEQNLYLVTAVVEFPAGKGSVYLYSDRTGEHIGSLQQKNGYWILNVQLEKGLYDLWLKAIDINGVESWYSLGSVNVVNELPSSSGNGETVGSSSIASTIRDTLLSTIVLLPVAGIIIYRKRKNLIKS